MKVFILILIFELCCIITRAQMFVGIQFGINSNKLSNTTTSSTDIRSKSELGKSIGISFQHRINPKIQVEEQIKFIEKNNSKLRTSEYSGIYNKNMNTFLEIPVQLNYRIFKLGSNKIFISLGGYIGYWIFAKQAGAIPNIYTGLSYLDNDNSIINEFVIQTYHNKNSFNSLRDNRVELGLISGFKINRTVNNKFDCSLNINYYNSIINQQKINLVANDRKFNKTFEISLSGMINL